MAVTRIAVGRYLFKFFFVVLAFFPPKNVKIEFHTLLKTFKLNKHMKVHSLLRDVSNIS